MKYTIPHYFENFRCLAAECDDTCCAGWLITIDDNSLEKYKSLEGLIGNRIRNSVDWETGCFCQHEHRCVLLNEDNLCDLHMEAGEQMLCDTCRDYPRHMEEFEGVREGSLSLSCVGAARLILGCREPVQFFTFEDDVEDEEYEEFDALLFEKLTAVREKIITLLQNRNVDIMMRMGIILELVEKIQKAVDEKELSHIDTILEDFAGGDMLFALQQKAKDNKMGENEFCTTMRKMFRIFQKLEPLSAGWPEYIKKAEFTLYSEGQRMYDQSRREFHKIIGLESPNYEEWSAWIEQLLVYFVFTHFCGAVYDGKAAEKIQTAIVFVLLIQELALAKWLDSDKVFHFEMFVDIAHRAAREIEHSDVNLSRLEKICEKNPIFHAQQLLRVILY